MKYVRTKDGIYEVKHDEKSFIYKGSNMIAIYDPKIYQVRDISKDEIIKQANDIKDLCDELVIYFVDSYHLITIYNNGDMTFKDGFDYGFTLDCAIKNNLIICGAIWTKGNKGEPILKSVAKIKGILPNDEIDWELL